MLFSRKPSSHSARTSSKLVVLKVKMTTAPSKTSTTALAASAAPGAILEHIQQKKAKTSKIRIKDNKGLQGLRVLVEINCYIFCDFQSKGLKLAGWAIQRCHSAVPMAMWWQLRWPRRWKQPLPEGSDRTLEHWFRHGEPLYGFSTYQGIINVYHEGV